MRIGEACGLFPQNNPGAQAVAAAIPAEGGDIRRFREPEGAGIDKVIFILAVKNRVKLACLLPIIAAHANPAVFRQAFGEILHPILQRLLQAEGIGLCIPQGLDDQRGAALLRTQAIPAIADVKG